MQGRGIAINSLFTAAFLLAAVSLFAQGGPDNIRSANGRILRLEAAMHRASAVEKGQIQAEAAPVFAQRAAALTELIRQDPNAALSLAFSQDLLDALSGEFPGSASALERHGVWSGTSDHLIFDDPERQVRRFQVQIHSGNDSAEVYSAAGEPHCVSGDILTVAGVRVGKVIAAGNNSVQSSGSVAQAGCTTTGTQSAAILLVEFPGIALPSSVTSTGVWDIFFANSGRSVRNYWEEASYGKASAAGDVFGPFTLDRVYSCDEYYPMRDAAIAAADSSVDFRNYTRIFIVFPNPGSCGWAGLGTLGCSTLSSADGSFTASTSWLLATYMGTRDDGVKLSTHEGGHNLTLHHASSRDFGAEALGPVGATGTLSEYGDIHSTMGSWNFGTYGAPHKVRMGWLSPSNVVTTESNGSFTILPYELATGSVQALKVRRGTGTNAWLWLEYRQPLGQYDSTLNSQIFTGSLVHYEDSTTSNYTHLLDFTTATSSFADAALVGSWVDPYTNVSLSVTNASSTGLDVTVNYGPVPCVRTQPTVTTSPGNPSVYSGASVNYTVTILNNDSSGCAASSFGMSSTLPSTWTASFSQASLTLNPAQSGNVTMTVTVPSGFTPGTYPVSATGSDANHSATGNANATVTAPPEPILMSLSLSSSVVSTRSNETITAVVTKQNGGSPVSGASVTFRVTRSNGAATTNTVTTNAQGVAQWSYKAQQKGSYSVTATAVSSGASASAGPMSFTAN
jgi:M6 family metalloprotease-like protein